MEHINYFQILQYKRDKGGVHMCEILHKLKDLTPSELLSKYNISPEPPVDLSSLLKNIGISSIATDFSDVEKDANCEPDSILGATISNGDNLGIFYRSKDSKNRQTFTIAHELAHCCLHSESLKDNHVELRDDRIQLSGKEYDTNVFAGELLIPEKSLRKIYDELLLPSLSSLSEIFQVSTNVMAARLEYLNLDYLRDIKISED